jgi:hypothetical protein
MKGATAPLFDGVLHSVDGGIIPSNAGEVPAKPLQRKI